MATIQGVYVALFGRPADPTGLAYFNSVTNNGANLSAIGNLASTAEYQGRFAGLNNLQIINSIYQSLFGRDADVTGLTFFANQLSSGRQTINTIAINILDGARDSDLTTVNNKIAAADLYTKALDTGPEIVAYSGTAAADAGRTFLQGVTTTVPSQAAVDTAVATMVGSSSSNPGSSFTLTANIDAPGAISPAANLTATAGNDTFNAIADGQGNNNQSTLQIADTINGGAGVDTLALRVTANGDIAVTNAPTLTSIERVAVSSLHNGTSTIALAGIGADVTTVASIGSLGRVDFTGVSKSANTVELKNIASNNADLRVTTVAGLTGTADAVTINVANNSAATTTTAANFAEIVLTGAAAGDGYDVVNVVSAGGASRLDLLSVTDSAPASTLRTLNITGESNFRVNQAIAFNGTTGTVDASKATGNINLTFGGNDLTVTGGSGADRFAFGTSLTTADKVDGGAGRDTIGITTATLTADTTQALNKALNAVTNFEVVEFGATTVTSVAANGLSTIKELAFAGVVTGTAGADAVGTTNAVAGADAIAVTGLTSDNKIFAQANETGLAGGAGLTGGTGALLNGAAGGDALDLRPLTNGPADIATVTLEGVTLTGGNGGAAAGTGTNGNGGYGINASQFETLNLVSTGSSATATNSLVAGVAGATAGGAVAGSAGAGLLVNTNGTVNLTGANDITLSVTTADPVAGGVQFKAGDFTGKLVLTASAGNDSIIGGSGNDIIDSGLGRDTIDLTKGGIDIVRVGTTANDRDTITGFTAGAGGDILDVANQTATLTTNDDIGSGAFRAVTGASVAFTILGDGTQEVVAFNFNAANNSANLNNSTTGSELFKAIANEGSVITGLTAANNDTGNFVAYQGGDAFIYRFANGNDTTLDASEVTLVGVVKAVAVGSLTDANFA